jgi:hypothetical protein
LLPHRAEAAGEEGHVRILEGVPPLASRRGKQCTLTGCFEAVLRYHGGPWDYVDLMGLSGAAFRLRIAYPTGDQLMGGRIHPGISMDASVGPHVQALVEATGYECEVDAHVFHEPPDHRRIAARIEREIDQGRPVIAMNLADASCWGVIAGYDPALPLHVCIERNLGERYFARTYFDPPDSGYERAPCFPWDVYFVSRAGDPLPAELALPAAVERAVALLETESGQVSGPLGWMAGWKPEYANGLRAYDAWIADLTDEEGIARLGPDQSLMYWQGHAWMYDQLHDARRAAAEYLRRIAPRFADAEASRLHEASGVYDRLVGLMTQGWPCFPYREGGYVEPITGWRIRVEREEFLGAQVPAYAGEWITEDRRRGIALLEALRELEEQALAALREAV